MIAVVNLSKQYRVSGESYTALKNINLQIPSGTSVAITGRSGSGKSTLMHLLSGLDTPDSGQIVIDGVSLQGLRKRQLDDIRNKLIGFVFQSFYTLPHDTVWENVALPLEILGLTKAERQKDALEALEFVGLINYANSHPTELSGGQKQRVCVARAIITRPPYIFADEPTGNLDDKTGEAVENLLFGMNERFKSTLVVVTHNAELAKRCAHKIEMDDGRIIKGVRGIRTK